MMKYTKGYTFKYGNSTFTIVDSYESAKGLMFRAENEKSLSEHFTLNFLIENKL